MRTSIGPVIVASGIASTLWGKILEPAVVEWIDRFFQTHFDLDYESWLKKVFENPAAVDGVFVIIITGILLWIAYMCRDKIPSDFFQRRWGIIVLVIAIVALFFFQRLWGLVFLFAAIALSALLLLLKKWGAFHVFWTKLQTRIFAFWSKYKKWILGITVAVSIVALLSLAVVIKGILHSKGEDENQPKPPECIVGPLPCGEYVTWEFYDDGTLKISGNGEMEDYSHDGKQEGEKKPAPWWSRRNKIQRVEIAHEVRIIGSGAFSSCGVLESVSFTEAEATESDLNAIGAYAFYSRPVRKPCNRRQKALSSERVIKDE